MKSIIRAALALALLGATAQSAAAASCATDDPDGSKTAAARAAADSMCAGMGAGCNSGNHGAYVSCVAHAANTLSSGPSATLPKSCKGALKKCAARSTCGKSGAVTCCVTSATTGKTKCKIKKDATLCTGTVGTCASCCDACSGSGSGPSCPAGSTTTTTTTTT